MSRFGATGNDLSIGISEDHIPTAVSGLNCLDRLSCADRCGKKLFPMLPRVSRPQLPIYAARRVPSRYLIASVKIIMINLDRDSHFVQNDKL